HGQVTAVQPVSDEGIVGRRSTEECRASGGLSGKPSIDQATVGKEFRRLVLSTEQELMGGKAFPEALNGRHGEQEVAEPSRVQNEDCARHAPQEDDGLTVWSKSERAAARSAGGFTVLKERPLGAARRRSLW